MTLDTLTRRKSQAQTRTTLDLLIGNDSLQGRLSAFLLAGKVEGLAAPTLLYYKDCLNRFVKCCTEMQLSKLSDVKTEHIRYFMSQLQETNKPVSVNCYFRAVRRFFNWSMVEKIIEVNPMSVIRPPRVPEKVIIPFADEDILKMVTLCDARNWFIDRRNKAIILTFLDSGLRLLEMFNVKLADVDLENGSILVMGKGAKQRFVPISHVTSKAIMSYLYMRSDKYPNMWLSEERVPLKSPNSIQQMIGTIAKRAGVTGVRASPHTFRHTFGTRTLENGANVFQVKALLGHATLDMTRKYSASLDSRQAVEAHHGVNGHKGFSPVENMKLR